MYHFFATAYLGYLWQPYSGISTPATFKNIVEINIGVFLDYHCESENKYMQ